MRHMSLIAAIGLGAVVLASAAPAQTINREAKDGDQTNGMTAPKPGVDDSDLKALDPIKPPDPKTAPVESFGDQPLGSEAWEYGQPGERGTKPGEFQRKGAGDAPLPGSQVPPARPNPGSRLP